MPAASRSIGAASVGPQAVRRRLLIALGLWPCFAGCARQAATLRARFAVPGWGEVTLDARRGGDFRLHAALGGVETWVLGDAIHLLSAPSLAFAGEARIYRVGRLRVPAPAADALPPLLPRAVQAIDRALPAVTADIEWPDGRGRVDRFQLGHAPGLARAQYVASAGLAASMDMDLCGGAVQRLLALWPAQLIAGDLAMLGSDSGLRLLELADGDAAPLRLPLDSTVEDYRPFGS